MRWHSSACLGRTDRRLPCHRLKSCCSPKPKRYAEQLKASLVRSLDRPTDIVCIPYTVWGGCTAQYKTGARPLCWARCAGLSWTHYGDAVGSMAPAVTVQTTLNAYFRIFNAFFTVQIYTYSNGVVAINCCMCGRGGCIVMWQIVVNCWLLAVCWEQIWFLIMKQIVKLKLIAI